MDNVFVSKLIRTRCEYIHIVGHTYKTRLFYTNSLIMGDRKTGLTLTQTQRKVITPGAAVAESFDEAFEFARKL